MSPQLGQGLVTCRSGRVGDLVGEVGVRNSRGHAFLVLMGVMSAIVRADKGELNGWVLTVSATWWRRR